MLSSCYCYGDPRNLPQLTLSFPTRRFSALATSLDQVARDVDKLLDQDTMIVTVQNGMPWWYFHDFKGPLNGTRLKSLDPSGLLERHIHGGRIVGCVVYPAAAVTEPGVVPHVEGDRKSTRLNSSH